QYFSFTIPHPPSSTLFPYTTLFRSLFHRLNNQLGIILANAELLEAKATDDVHRARAAQVVTSALEAMGTAKEIRRHTSAANSTRSEEHTSELQSLAYLVCRLLLEKK